YTQNERAIATAKIVNKWQSLAKYNMNRAGAWIGDYAGYISRTSHDAMKIWKADFNDWNAYTLSKLDQGRTFEGIENPGEFMRHVFDDLVSENFGNGHTGMKDPAFTGPGNLGKRLSASRVLHWADADSWMDYQERFGRGTLAEQINHSLYRAGRDQALL